MKHCFPGLVLLCALGSDIAAQPGYWQQQVDNHITVTLDDQAHVLRGDIRIHYRNQSPDTLKFIWFHLYPNAYSTDRTAYAQQAVENGNTDHYFSDETERGAIDSLRFLVTMASATRPAGVVTTADPDVIRVVLPEPLAPGGSVDIETPFRVKLPSTFSRLGHTGQRYQISQWFPKPAVYDSKGWHPMPYLDQGEFYSEYGKYHVEITLPQNYIVMATGKLQDAGEEAWLDSLSRLPAPRAREKAIREDRDTASVRSSSTMKTLVFEEAHIHDFAWFADKQWVVRKDTVTVPGSGAVVSAYVCYRPAHQYGWSGAMEALKTAILKYSAAVGPYPYSTVKAVEGGLRAGGGMEYPTVTVISPTNDPGMVRTAVVHEAGHNWFYGILGSNERDYPWMDESVNSFYEQRFAPLPPSIRAMGRNDMFLAYAQLAATRNLVPADTAAAVMPEANYGGDIYGKAAYQLAWLEAYMGKADFEKAMQAYYREWQYKHPQPGDFEQIFREHTSRNLDWFFNGVMKTTKPVDFAITKVRKSRDRELAVTVKNRSGIHAPAVVQLNYIQDGRADSVLQCTAPFTGDTVLRFSLTEGQEPGRVKIAEAVADYNIRNNEDRSPLALRPFLGFNLHPATKIWYAPAVGINHYDGFMAGLLLHNFTLPQNRFQFALAPLYAFGSKTLAGTGFAGYTAYIDEGLLHDIQLNLGGKTFTYTKNNFNIPQYLYARFIKVAPELVFNLRKPSWRSTVARSLSLKGYWVREAQLGVGQNPADSSYFSREDGYEDHIYGRVRYRHENNRTFNPFNYTLEAQAGRQFAKLSVEANLRVDYFKKNKALYLRGYAGKFFSFTDDPFGAARYRLATVFTGRNDYLYDDTYFGRNETNGNGAEQISIREGGFKTPTPQLAAPVGLSDNWLFALNIKTDIPLWNLPVRLYADVATFPGAKAQNPSGAGILYGAGIELYAGDLLSVYVPLVLSKDFSEYNKSMYPDNRFWRSITLSLNIGDINWGKLPAKMLRM